MKTNAEYRATARKALEGHWNEAAIVAVVLLVITGICAGSSAVSELITHAPFVKSAISSSSMLLQYLIAVPLSTAFSFMVLDFMRGEKNLEINGLIEPLKKDYGRILVTCVLMGALVSVAAVVTIFLLCIPAIILGMYYGMVPFLLRDYKELTWRETLRTSREMMRGHVWQYFCLQMSFIGWIILAILTCGIGLIWLQPYIIATEAAFYDDLKAETITEVEETPAETVD